MVLGMGHPAPETQAYKAAIDTVDGSGHNQVAFIGTTKDFTCAVKCFTGILFLAASEHFTEIINTFDL